MTPAITDALKEVRNAPHGLKTQARQHLAHALHAELRAEVEEDDEHQAMLMETQP